jgi:GGDEF domain-containing protein
LGGATYPDDAEDFETLVQKADQALYYSKRNGKNRCSIYDIQVIGEPLK